MRPSFDREPCALHPVDTHYGDTGYHFLTSMSLYGLHDGTWPDLESGYLADRQDAIAVRNADYFVRSTDRVVEWDRQAEGVVE